ncbi:MAG: hypothetical protein ABUS54_14825 [Actinomycetota bacterium]
MDLRAQRAAENEKLFRRINERVEALSEGEILTLVCECADVACVERIPGVPLDEYEEVRSHEDRFFVIRGHELLDVERVVDERAGHLVVAKSLV